jgi:cytochrome c-type biogenesis protein CcmH
MMIVIASLLAAGLALLLVQPLLSRAAQAAARGEHDLAIYREQLAELERERAQGLIGAREAEAAKAEIARRAFAAAKASEATATPARRPTLAIVAAVAAPVAALAIHLVVGRPAIVTAPPDSPQAAIAALPPEQREAAIRSMVDSLAARLEQQPDDLAGWRRLANARRVLGELDAARKAAARAASLAPDDADVLAEYAELLLPPSAEHALPAELVDVLRRIVALRPDHVQSLFFLGFAAARERRIDEAAGYWNRLLAILPADSPLSIELKRRLAELRSRQGG